MDKTRREKREHGTLEFPFQIYPALDGSEAHDSDYIPYHWHPELEIIEVQEGEVSVTIADHEYLGNEGDIFFVGSEQLHEIRATGEENQFHSFVFAMDFLQFERNDQVQTQLLTPIAQGSLCFQTELRAEATGQAEISGLLYDIMYYCVQQPEGYQLFVKAALLNIIAVCTEKGLLTPNKLKISSDYKAKRLKDIVSYLEEHFFETLTLGEVASRFGMSPQYFCAFFKENFGKTLTQHINSLRMEQAARLLRETDLPVMQIGFQVGYDNFSYFIKRFRAVYGVSPTQYRKKTRVKIEVI